MKQLSEYYVESFIYLFYHITLWGDEKVCLRKDIQNASYRNSRNNDAQMISFYVPIAD